MARQQSSIIKTYLIKHKLLWIIGIGLVLRLISLNQSYWLDEAINVTAASTRSYLDLITNYSLGDFHPPLYHPLLKTWIELFGSSEIATRSFSIILGLAVGLFSFWLATDYFAYNQAKLKLKRFPLNSSQLTLLLVMISPLLIYYSQEARMYMLAAAGYILAVWAAYRLLVQNRTRSITLSLSGYITRLQTHPKVSFGLWLGMVIFTYTDYVPWLALPVFVIFFPIISLLALLPLLPWMPLFFEQLSIGLSTANLYPEWGRVVGGFSLKNIALIPVKFLIGRVNYQPQWWYGLISILGVGAVLASLGSQIKIPTKLKDVKIPNLFVWLVSFSPIVIGIGLSTQVSLLSYFRFIFVLPLMYLLFVAGLSRLPIKWRQACLGLVLIISLVSTGRYLTMPEYQREDWRGLSRWIDQQEVTGQAIIPNLAQAAPYQWYQKEVPIYDHVETLPVLSESIYYIRYVPEIYDPNDEIPRRLEELGYVWVENRDFNGVLVWHYQYQQKLFAQR